MGSSNPVKTITDPIKDQMDRINDNGRNLAGDIKDDPGRTVPYVAGQVLSAPLIPARQAAIDTRDRLRNDAEDQGQRQANKDAEQAAAAERAAADAAPKGLDPLTAERRRRALAARAGRAGTDITGGSQLGSVDVARKVLLGM